jgi:hypothetical protein
MRYSVGNPTRGVLRFFFKRFEGGFSEFNLIEQAHESAAVFPQCCLVDLFLVGGAGLPAFPDNALPFEGQGANGGVMVRTPGALLEVVSGSPAAPQHTLLGILVKALPVELGAEIAAVNVTTGAAAFGDRSDLGVTLRLAAWPKRSREIPGWPTVEVPEPDRHRAGSQKCRGRDGGRRRRRSVCRSCEWSVGAVGGEELRPSRGLDPATAI